MTRAILRSGVFLLLTLLPWQTALSASRDQFLPVDEAFEPAFELAGDVLQVRWTIAPGYYLYQSRITVSDPSGALALDPPVFAAPGEEKNDPYFGEQRVFHDQASMKVPFQVVDRQALDQGTTKLTVSYQGCAEAGLCYPPQHRNFTIRPAAAQAALTDSPPAPSGPQQTKARDTESSGGIASFIGDASLPVILGTFFLLGLGLTFTPCVLPMVPILSSIIVGQQQPVRATRALNLSVAYVLGMATTYTLIGVVVGYLGARANIQAWMQQPVVLSVFVVLFVVLALSMFGLFELQLPAGLRERLDRAGSRHSGGQWLSVATMGAISALVVSPCVTAPLAGTLLYISSTGDALLGGASLFTLAMGMGTPLILVGATGARVLPKAGMWMERVKQFFGLILLAVAVWLLERIIPSTAALLLWAALLIFSALHLGALRRADNMLQRTGQAAGLMIFLWGIFVLFAAASGSGTLFTPLKGIQTRAAGTFSADQPPELFETVRRPDQLQITLGKGQPVVVDIYADWCISCKIMEEEIFSGPKVRQLAEEYRFIKLDITEFNGDHKAYLEQLRLVGPPAILFFAADGHEVSQARIAGEAGLPEFLEAIDTVRAKAG